MPLLFLTLLMRYKNRVAEQILLMDDVLKQLN
jgi:hypothetical protein